MRLADQIRLKVPRCKSVDTVVEVARRNNLSGVELKLESQVKYLRGEPFRENTSTVYVVLDGRRAELHRTTYAEDLRSPGQDDHAALSAEDVVRQMIEIGQQLRKTGLTPTVLGYETDFDRFIADFQRAQHAPVPEFYDFLNRFRQQIN